MLGRVEAGWREGEQRLKGRVSSITSKVSEKGGPSIHSEEERSDELRRLRAEKAQFSSERRVKRDAKEELLM